MRSVVFANFVARLGFVRVESSSLLIWLVRLRFDVFTQCTIICRFLYTKFGIYST